MRFVDHRRLTRLTSNGWYPSMPAQSATDPFRVERIPWEKWAHAAYDGEKSGGIPRFPDSHPAFPRPRAFRAPPHPQNQTSIRFMWKRNRAVMMQASTCGSRRVMRNRSAHALIPIRRGCMPGHTQPDRCRPVPSSYMGFRPVSHVSAYAIRRIPPGVAAVDGIPSGYVCPGIHNRIRHPQPTNPPPCEPAPTRRQVGTTNPNPASPNRPVCEPVLTRWHLNRPGWPNPAAQPATV